MTDEQGLQRIGELIAELARAGEEKEGRFFSDTQETLASFAKGFTFPPSVIAINKGGRIGLLLSINTPVGSAIVYYDAHPAIEKIFERLHVEANEEIDAISAENWEDEGETGRIIANSIHAWMYNEARTSTAILMKQLYFEFENTVKSLPEIALKLSECIRKASSGTHIIVEDDDGSISGDGCYESLSFSPANFINNSLEELNRERKKQWKAEVDSSVEKYDRLWMLGLYFERVYPVWEQAKEMYKESQKSTDKTRRMRWRETILATYEKELKDVSDLVECLADAQGVPVEIYEKILKKGVTSAPQDIALQHAARLCGFPDYKYTTRHLKSVLSRQGRSARKVKSRQRAKISQKEH